MEKKLMSLKVDYAFKLLFSKEGNDVFLIDFLNSVLQLPPDNQVQAVQYLNTEIPRERPTNLGAAVRTPT